MTETPPKTSKLVQQTMSVLRKENRGLETKNRSLLTQISKLENNQLKHEQRARVAEEVREVLFDAVRLLAEQVDNNSAKGRKARERARRLLETSGLTPPGTLGHSRTKKKRKKSRRKKRS